MAKLLKSLTPGDTLVVPGSKHNGVAPVLRKLADDHHALGTTLLDTRDIIDLIAVDGKEPTNSNTDRKNNGNNNYGVSNIRKYLNSVGPNWYTPQHAQDAPPNAANVWSGHGPYDKRNGFLSAFPTEFVERIDRTTLTTVVPNTDGAGVSTQKDKVFLLSRTEVGLGDEREAEGKVIPFFKDNASRLKKPTQQALDNTTYTSSNLATTKPWHWWLRSPDAASARHVRGVYSGGALNYSAAYIGSYGAAPALNLPSDTLVSDAPNAQGHYEIMLNNPPKLTLNEQNAKVLQEGDFLHVVGQATDADTGDVVSIFAQINSETRQTLDGRMSDGSSPIPYDEKWYYRNGRIYRADKAISGVLAEGKDHSLKVWAEDNKGGVSTVQTRTFQTIANRPPVITITEANGAEGLLPHDKVTISGTVVDPDNDPNVKLFSKLNLGELKAVELSPEGAFTVAITISELKDSDNTLTLIAEDSHSFRSQTAFKISNTFVGKDLDKLLVRYALNPKQINQQGNITWIERSPGAEITVSLSLVAKGGAESYKQMTLQASTELGDVVEDEFDLFVDGTDLTDAVIEIKVKNGTVSKISGAFQPAKEVL